MPESGTPLRRRTLVMGWVAFGLGLLITLLWAWWGTLEAFHEGWWADTLGGRLFQTCLYLTPMLICGLICAAAVRWPRIGGSIYILIGLAFGWMVFSERRDNLTFAVVMSWIPVTGLMVAIGVLWWFGTVRPHRRAYQLLVALPLLTFLVVGAYPAWKVNTRHTDVSLEAQLVEGNGVSLVWAPAGPGWVLSARDACDWHTAVDICSRLNEDGTQLMEEAQNFWRLPTVDEAVRSMARHGVNSGGVMTSESKAKFEVMPDKEPPLWDPFAETIYWWTATEDTDDSALIVVYDGNIWSRAKKMRLGSMGFRAVKDPPGSSDDS